MEPAASRTPQHPSDSLFVRPASWFEPLNWEAVFPRDSALRAPRSAFRPVHVDLGAGDGGFVCERAACHPEMCFLAVERLLGRARKIARRACRNRLGNLRVLRIEASYAVEKLFPAGSVSAITILFPDPWPKRRHQKNRLVQPAFLVHCAACLEPGGWLAIKTDDASYFEQIGEGLAGCAGLRVWKEVHPDELLPETSDFEKTFLGEGRPVFFAAARRC